MIKKMAE